MTDLSSAPVPPLRDDDHVRGDAAWPLVVFYGDFACPRCVLAYERMRDAELRIAFRHFALRAKHVRAVALARAAEAAAAQGAFWAFADAVYADSGRTDDPHLWAHADRLGLDLARFDADRQSAPAADRVARDVADGIRAGVTVTPTLFVAAQTHPGPPEVARVREWEQLGSTRT